MWISSGQKMKKLDQDFGRVKQEYFDFENIRRYFQNNTHQDSLQVIPDKTCSDLDFEALFMYADRTCCKPGQQYLYNRMRNIPADGSWTDTLEANVQTLDADPQLRREVQHLLSGLNKPEAHYISALFQEKHKQPPAWFPFIRVLPFVNLLLLGLTFLNAPFLIPFVFLTIAHLIIHYRNKLEVIEYAGPLPQLLRMNQVARKISHKGHFGKNPAGLRESIQHIDRLRSRMSIFRLEAKLQSDVEGIIWGALEILKIVFLLEPLAFFNVMRQLENHRKDIRCLFEFIGSVDTSFSVLSLRKSLDTWSIPQITGPEKEFSAEGMYHPLIAGCVENDIQVNDRSVLLTGSNMSGKTTFIRTIGLNAMCALTLNTCFAEGLQMPRTRIYTAIRISDDLINDRSFYFEEVLTIKRMIQASRKSTANLFLLDEIYKGTNTIERISGGKAVLSYLNRSANLVFVSTHDVELTELLHGQYDLYHFTEQVRQGEVDFDYKLKKGKLTTRNAIKILELNGYPPDVIREAQSMAQELTRLKMI